VVWPGITAFPDWFNPNTQDFWNNQFATFFDADTGVDIDGLWIDMNEASNFCVYPCSDLLAFAISNGDHQHHLLFDLTILRASLGGRLTSNRSVKFLFSSRSTFPRSMARMFSCQEMSPL
jgi:alpha-glucosidase (family GH31 glycosyl hydrolase)